MGIKRDFILVKEIKTGQILPWASDFSILSGENVPIPNFDMPNKKLHLIFVNYSTSGGGTFVFEDDHKLRYYMRNSDFNKLLQNFSFSITENFTFRKNGRNFTIRMLDTEEKPIKVNKIMEEFNNGKNIIDF